MANTAYTVKLKDLTYGREALVEVVSDTAAHASTAAAANPGLSGDNSGSGNYTATTIVNDASVMVVTGTDNYGNAVVSPTSLPPVPPLAVGSTVH